MPFRNRQPGLLRLTFKTARAPSLRSGTVIQSGAVAIKLRRLHIVDDIAGDVPGLAV